MATMDFMVHLEDLTLQELQLLVDDEDKINQFVLDDEKLKSIKLERELIMVSNRSLAEANLGEEPKMNKLKTDLGEKYTTLKELREAYETNQVKLASLNKEENLDSMLAVLQAKSAESEEKTEALAEKLNNNQIDCDSFVTEFIKLRKVAHLRRAKVDKMRELILEMRRNEVHNNPAPYPTPPQAAPRGRHGSNPVPLPAQPANQPPYPPYPGYGHPGLHPSSSFPQAHQPYPSTHQQQYSQYQW